MSRKRSFSADEQRDLGPRLAGMQEGAADGEASGVGAPWTQMPGGVQWPSEAPPGPPAARGVALPGSWTPSAEWAPGLPDGGAQPPGSLHRRSSDSWAQGRGTRRLAVGDPVRRSCRSLSAAP